MMTVISGILAFNRWPSELLKPEMKYYATLQIRYTNSAVTLPCLLLSQVVKIE